MNRRYNNSPWREDEDRYVIDNYASMSVREMHHHLGRSEGSICGRANLLGVIRYQGTGWKGRVNRAMRTYKEILKRRNLRLREVHEGRATIKEANNQRYLSTFVA